MAEFDENVMMTQCYLRAFGYDAGDIDGDKGGAASKTNKARLAFLADHNLSPETPIEETGDILKMMYDDPRDPDGLNAKSRVREIIGNGDTADARDIKAVKGIVTSQIGAGLDVLESDIDSFTVKAYAEYKDMLGPDIKPPEKHSELKNPVDEKVREAQALMHILNIPDVGPIDGQSGPMTHAAINDFKQTFGVDKNATFNETLYALQYFYEKDPEAPIRAQNLIRTGDENDIAAGKYALATQKAPEPAMEPQQQNQPGVRTITVGVGDMAP